MNQGATMGFGMVAMTLAFGVLGVAPVNAETVSLKAQLSGATEVPPNDERGTGSVAITLDTATKKLTWNGSVSGLSGNPTAAHFHGPAEPGKNAGVIVPIGNPGPKLEGSADLTDAQMADMLAGRMYVNVHTAAHPGGELRGQVTK